MTPNIRRFTIVLAVAAALLLFFQLRKQKPVPRGHTARETSETTATQDAPRERVQGLEQRSNAAPTPSVAEREDPEDDDTIVAASYQDAIVERRARRLEASWKGGAPDEEWTRSARDSVTAQMQANNVRGKLRKVDCRTTLCRVEVEFARLEETMDLYKVQPANGHETYPVTSHEGTHVVVAVYVAPKDVQLKTITENQVR